jgi:hypothetical protein
VSLQDFPPRDIADREEMLKRIESPEIEDKWLAAFTARLERAERDAVRLYAEMRKWVGTERNLAVMVFAQLGTTEPEARRMIDAGKQVTEMSAEARFDECVRYVEAELLRDEGLRERATCVELAKRMESLA